MTEEQNTALAIQLGKVEAKLEERDRKLDAIHASIKEDLGRIEEQTTATNGRVRRHEERLAELRGAYIAFGCASPFLVAAIAYALTRLFG